jgi:hypothetical protein
MIDENNITNARNPTTDMFDILSARLIQSKSIVGSLMEYGDDSNLTQNERNNVLWGARTLLEQAEEVSKKIYESF